MKTSLRKKGSETFNASHCIKTDKNLQFKFEQVFKILCQSFKAVVKGAVRGI